MSSSSGKRVVAGTIDAGGVYCSRAAAGGGFVFVAGTAMDERGRLADAAKAGPPYEFSETAQARAQGEYLFSVYRDVLPQVGSSVDHIVQLEQYVKRKVHADAYFAVATAPENMGRARPGAATAQLREFFPAEAAISFTGFVIIPDEAAGFVKSYPGEDPAKRNPQRIFSEIVAAGPYVCTTYFPTDNQTGVHPSAKTEDWNWRGSEIRKEAEYGLEVVKNKLPIAGASLAEVVDYTLFLTDVGDLYDVDLVFRPALGEPAPTRTVIPTRGYAVPRREGAFGHAEGAPRMEVQFRCLMPGTGLEKVAVDGPGSGFGYQSAGMRVGPLLWLSSQMADAEARSDVAGELDNTFEKLQAVCRNGGTSISNLLRLRALITRPEDALAVYTAVRKAIPRDPPAVAIVVVDPPLPVGGCSVALDGVAFVEGA